MREMFRLLESKGYSRVSLSVQKANYAVRMYLKLGFKIIHETEEEFVMLKDSHYPTKDGQPLIYVIFFKKTSPYYIIDYR